MERSPLRLLGLTNERVANFRSQPNDKSAGMYAALDRRYHVVDVVRPAPSELFVYLNKLRHVHRDRNLWRSRASLSLAMFRRRSALAEQRLRQLEGQYDLIVQLHTLFAPGRLAARRPFVLHTDNTYILSERHYPAWAPLRGRARDAWVQMERATYQQAAFLFPRSEFLRRSLIDDYGCDPRRVIRVGGGANYSPAPLDGKRYDRQVALLVGYDFERKGGAALLQAWPEVRKRLPRAELWIVGPKQPLAPPQPGVIWQGHISDRAQVARMYAEATIFVLPARFEPWGHVFFEAMAYGLPCIGSTQGATPEIVRDGETGLLVPPDNVEALAAALIALLGDPRRAEAMGRAAQEELRESATWDEVVGRMAPYIEAATGVEDRYVGHAA
jgi:glycosyltransferase involved in cell wall biosynthesis